MKKILLLLLVPLTAFGQPIGQLQNDFISIEFSMEIDVQTTLDAQLFAHEFKDQNLALSIVINIPLFLINEKGLGMGEMIAEGRAPKHLNTFSISGLYPKSNQPDSAQKRLDYLMAMHDPEYPKENTLLEGLKPIRYENYRFGGAENMPQGFGPTISL